MRALAWAAAAALGAGGAPAAAAPAARYALGAAEAEARALRSSDQLQSALEAAAAAREQARSQEAALMPRLSLEASYRYVTEVPSLPFSLPGVPPLQFGTHSSYSVGPVLSYTLWDTGAAAKSYRSLLNLAGSRDEDRRTAERQLLLTVRSAYVRVQLALEQVRLVNDSLALIRAQDRDIASNYGAGAASRLDVVDSHREVISYELQYRQRQADLSAALKDLLALIYEDPIPQGTARPAPPGIADAALELVLDGLEASLAEAERWPLAPPGDENPQVKSQELLARSSELAAESARSSLYPTLLASAKASEDYPNQILAETVQQNTFSVSLSWPLFEGGRSVHQAAGELRQAAAARRRAAQAKTDLARDFRKAQDLLESLKGQRTLAAEDVRASEEAARLYYQSYQAGRINLTDVEAANVRALQAKVEAASIEAQLLQQLANLRFLAGGE